MINLIYFYPTPSAWTHMITHTLSYFPLRSLYLIPQTHLSQHCRRAHASPSAVCFVFLLHSDSVWEFVLFLFRSASPWGNSLSLSLRPRRLLEPASGAGEHDSFLIFQVRVCESPQRWWRLPTLATLQLCRARSLSSVLQHLHPPHMLAEQIYTPQPAMEKSHSLPASLFSLSPLQLSFYTLMVCSSAWQLGDTDYLQRWRHKRTCTLNMLICVSLEGTEAKLETHL